MNDYIELGANFLGKPKYFYLVDEYMTTFGIDKNRSDVFSTEKIFKGNLKEARAKAFAYYYERKEGAKNNSYHLPFASPDEFEFGKHAAYSLRVNLVEYYNDEDYIFHPVAGKDLLAMKDSWATEAMLFAEGSEYI